MNTCELSINTRHPAVAQARPQARFSVWRLLDVLADWHARAEQRRQLQEMPDYLLRDIGLAPEDVYREIRKPFWRA